MAKKEEENLKSILELKTDINKLTDEYNQLAKKSIALTEEEKSRLQEIDKERKKVAKELRDANKTRLENLAAEERGLSSLSDLYSSLTRKEQQRIIAQTDRTNLLPAEEDALNKMASLNRDLAQLNREDFAQRNSILEQMAAEEAKLGSIGAENQDLLQNLAEQKKIALNLSNLSKDQKQQIEGQLAAYKGMKQLVGGILDTFATLTSGPAGFFGTLFIAAGKAADKIGAVNKELGTTLSLTNSAANRAGLLSFVFDDAVSNTRALSRELGGLDKASGELQVNMSLVARSFGISGDEAAVLVGQFSRLQGGSTDTAMNMLATTRALAEANNVAPGDVLQEMAVSTEAFALYARDGGTNLAMAGVQAKKLGVELNTLTGITDNLLDFETSITKELELGAMLGKNINLNKARELAYQGDIEGATKATLAELGGIEAFNRMDYFQKKQTADLLGVSVAELQKMADNQGKAATLGDTVNAKFSKMGEIINGGLNKWLGTGLKGLGGMVTMAGQLGTGFSAMGINVGKIAGNIKDGAKNLMSKGWKMLTGAIGGGATDIASTATDSIKDKAKDTIKDSIKDKATDSIKDVGGKDGGGGASKFMESISKIKMSEVLKGAAAMLVVAAAVFVFGKAVQEFMKVSWEAVGMAVVSMLALVGAVALLGAIMMSGVGAVAILAGAAAMLVIASAVLVLGIGLQAIGTGFEMLSTGIAGMLPNITAMVGMLMPLTALVPVIAGLAGAFALLGYSLALVGVLGLPGLFVLAGIAALSAPIIKLASLLGIGGEGESAEGGSVGEGESETQSLIKEIQGLRNDLLSGKIAVYMDGKKLTSAVGSVIEGSGANTYPMN